MIDKLEYLLALAQERHFGRAAESCAVSQPSLSLGLKQLEDALGVMLVQRGSRFIGLTAEGERTLEWARRIVSDARAMRQDIKALKHGVNGRLRIAVIPAALPMVETVTRPLHQRYPDVEFTILSRTSVEILGMLDNLEIDAALSYLDVDPLTRVATIPLYKERYLLLAGSESRFVTESETVWSAVAELPLCLLTPDTQNRKIVEELLRSNGRAPRITLESDSLSVLYAHVRSGEWVTVIPERLAHVSELKREFHAIPIKEPDVVHTIGLVMPMREPTTPLSAALAAEARRAAARLMT
jgi:DNA-binding transcriptional LysR family regulator